MDDLHRKIQRNEQRLKQQTIPSFPSADQVEQAALRALRSRVLTNGLLACNSFACCCSLNESVHGTRRAIWKSSDAGGESPCGG